MLLDFVLYICSTDSQCIAYQFGGSANENCLVIHGYSTEESEHKFLSDGGSTVFKKGSKY